MNKGSARKFTYFIGVDVSRNKIDLAVRNLECTLYHSEVANEPSAIRNAIIELKNLEKFRLTKAIFCMEDSGYYVNHLLNTLHKQRANIHLGNPMHIKNSIGLQRNKSDRLDAIRMADYAYRHRDDLQFWDPKRKEINHLAALVTVRNRMITTLGIIRVPLKEQRGFIDRQLHKDIVDCCKKSLVALTDDLNLLERSILALIDADSKLKRIFEIICSVPHVGPVTAVQIIINTNEFRDIKCPRKFACYAGVAPFSQESGLTTGKTRSRISKVANRKMKALLHICAVGGIRHKGEFREYYDRRCLEGKPAMTIVNAIRNKLIRQIFACVNLDRLYLPPDELKNLQAQPGLIALSPVLKKTKPRKRTKFAKRGYGQV